MNYMEQVAQMLGVELREEFFIKNDNNRYWISENGMFRYSKYNEWVVSSVELMELLTGEAEIVKIPKPILDEVEKRYLSNVIKPFRSEVKYIVKCNDNKSEYFEDIRVVFEGRYSTLYFPYFEKGTMYKGMETDKEYSLDDLGL